MYGIYANIYHQYTPNVSIYTIHGSYGIYGILSQTIAICLRVLNGSFQQEGELGILAHGQLGARIGVLRGEARPPANRPTGANHGGLMKA